MNYKKKRRTSLLLEVRRNDETIEEMFYDIVFNESK